jgi:hypothetical protein
MQCKKVVPGILDVLFALFTRSHANGFNRLDAERFYDGFHRLLSRGLLEFAGILQG